MLARPCARMCKGRFWVNKRVEYAREMLTTAKLIAAISLLILIVKSATLLVWYVGCVLIQNWWRIGTISADGGWFGRVLVV